MSRPNKKEIPFVHNKKAELEFEQCKEKLMQRKRKDVFSRGIWAKMVYLRVSTKATTTRRIPRNNSCTSSIHHSLCLVCMYGVHDTDGVNGKEGRHKSLARFNYKTPYFVDELVSEFVS